MLSVWFLIRLAKLLTDYGKAFNISETNIQSLYDKYMVKFHNDQMKYSNFRIRLSSAWIHGISAC